MRTTMSRRTIQVALSTVGAALGLSLLAAPAMAAEGNIDHVEAGTGELRVLYSVPGLGEGVNPDLETLTATIAGKPVTSEASLAADSEAGIARTTILAIDVSRSMKGDRFTEAKRAAQTFLETAPLDVLVGIVTFAGEIEVVQEPTLDRAASIAALDDLELSLQTRLYDGVRAAVRTAGVDGQRSVLVLSDGADTSGTPVEDVIASIEDAEVQVDVVALGQSPAKRGPLEEIAQAGKGSVLSTDDPQALAALFESEAQALAKQVLVTIEVPASVAASEGTLALSVVAGGEEYVDSAFVPLRSEVEASTTGHAKPKPVGAAKFVVSQPIMLAGLAAAFIGMLFLLLSVFGVFTRQKTETLEDRIAAYKQTGDARSAAGTPGVRLAAPQRPESLTGAAVGVAQKALDGNKGLEAALGSKLEAAGLALKPAEWLLAHAGIAIGAGLVGFLLTGGNILFAGVFLLLGGVVPYIFLGLKKKRRLKAFDGQLADTLQLMSGSLSAGLSLAQSADTVVREGTEPIAGEFRRALVEARLGVQIEDSLDSVAERMESDDFRWVVMAIRIQREVGGNLAELLLQVAATLREREYLRRQVSALSAEGRLSAWILGGLPPVFTAYLALVKPTYLAPMLSSPMGWVMFGMMGVLLTIGVFWMSKMVKVEV